MNLTGLPALVRLMLRHFAPWAFTKESRQVQSPVREMPRLLMVECPEYEPSDYEGGVPFQNKSDAWTL